MNQMKVQLDDGSVSAGKLKEQVSELGKTSQDMAKQYGVAGESIRNGMNELIKKVLLLIKLLEQCLAY